RYELVRTHIGELHRLGAPELRRLFAELEAEGRERLRRTFSGPTRVVRALDMRYGEQIFEITVPVDDVDLDARDVIEQVVARFHRRHEELYAYSAPGQEVVVVNARVAVVGRLPVLPADGARRPAAAAAPSRRRVYLDGWREVPLYRMQGLAAGQELPGPALVESATTTVLLREREQATVTPEGWLDVRLG
ncbi:MAG TPA: hydantoinase/oxoprolinase family protein, partial [Candidatus Tectomicrobia bacterium]|nr:hydantoinase/oxoprolinase family protein [Candidatus Tectomicrobia bacterium]